MKGVPTQKILKIKNINKGVMFLEDGSLAKILAIDGINLSLKSEEEKQVIASQFQSFLNSLDFDLQIVVHSRQKNLAAYIRNLEKRLEETTEELMQTQIREYIEFLKYLGKTGSIMRKDFFVVVSYRPFIVSKEGLLTKFKSLFSKKEKTKEKESEEEKLSQEKKIEQLNQRVDLVVDGLTNIGLNVIILETKEIIELFYNLYNPGLIEINNLEVLSR